MKGDFSFLSNFYAQAPFEWEGAIYPTAEHAFQAAKCARPDDRKLFAACAKPGEARRLGRRVELRADWDDAKIDVMESVLRAKFALPELRRKLAATGTTRIIHSNNWHDQYWGHCICPMHARQQGGNRLGKLLMKIREEALSEQHETENQPARSAGDGVARGGA